MTEDDTEREEVVVVGYGTQKEIGPDQRHKFRSRADLIEQPVPCVDQLLRGRVAWYAGRSVKRYARNIFIHSYPRR